MLHCKALAVSPPKIKSHWCKAGSRNQAAEGQRWTQELDLKVRQFEALLRGPVALAAAPNINALHARLLVEELCRLGVSTFCIAPGVQSGSLPCGYEQISIHAVSSCTASN